MRRDSKIETDFHRHQNVSYLDPKLPRATVQQGLRHYAASAMIYGVVLVFFRVCPWFRSLLSVPLFGYRAWVLYCYAYAAYLLVGPLVFFVGRPRSLWVSKNLRIAGYLAKNMFWLMTLLPAFIPNTSDPRFTWSGFLLFCATTVFGFIGWGTLYFLRALTEEKFLMRDPDYVAYCRKVKYRFIPGVY